MAFKRTVAVRKGHTVTVISDEYDADNPNQASRVFDTKQEAVAVFKMCTEFFKCKDSNPGCIGNLDTKHAYELVTKYLLDSGISEMLGGILNAMRWFEQLVEDLCLNGTEDFYRVCCHCTVTYSSRDIYVLEILTSE